MSRFATDFAGRVWYDCEEFAGKTYAPTCPNGKRDILAQELRAYAEEWHSKTGLTDDEVLNTFFEPEALELLIQKTSDTMIMWRVVGFCALEANDLPFKAATVKEHLDTLIKYYSRITEF